jgi:hypothetical protein
MMMHTNGSTIPVEAGGTELRSPPEGNACFGWVKVTVVDDNRYACSKRNRKLAGNG